MDNNHDPMPLLEGELPLESLVGMLPKLMKDMFDEELTEFVIRNHKFRTSQQTVRAEFRRRRIAKVEKEEVRVAKKEMFSDI